MGIETPPPEISFAAQLYKLTADAPNDPALTFAQRTYSRDDLNCASNQLARHFQNLGVSRGDFVTIADPNGVQFIPSVFACWKMGAIPQPVSARLPTLELKAIIELAN